MTVVEETSAPSQSEIFAPAKGWKGRAGGFGLGLLFIVGAFFIGGMGEIIAAQAMSFSLTRPPSSITVLVVTEALQWVGVLLMTVAIGARMKLNADGLGYGAKGAGRGVGIGLLAGFGLQAAIIAILAAAGMIHFGPLNFKGLEGPGYAVGFAILFSLVPLVEEGMLRSVVLNAFARTGGFWFSAIVTSLIFFMLHAGNPGESTIGLANVFLVGFVLAWTRYRTGSLWFALGFHGAWDYAQSYVFGVPDSGLTITGALTSATIHGPDWLAGGTVGPEGGVLCTLSLAVLALIVHFGWPKKA